MCKVHSVLSIRQLSLVSASLVLIKTTLEVGTTWFTARSFSSQRKGLSYSTLRDGFQARFQRMRSIFSIQSIERVRHFICIFLYMFIVLIKSFKTLESTLNVIDDWIMSLLPFSCYNSKWTVFTIVNNKHIMLTFSTILHTSSTLTSFGTQKIVSLRTPDVYRFSIQSLDRQWIA